MCGRYTLIRHDHLVGIFHNITIPANLRLVARYNIAPTQDCPIILPTSGGGGVELQLARWGLVPHWAKDQSIGTRMINTRGETLAQKPAFKNLLARQRCLVPADGFYEWQRNPAKKAGPKIPHYIRLKSRDPFAFAGLFDDWESHAGESVRSFTIITVPANALIAAIHDRMPAILLGETAQSWLTLSESADALALLCPLHPALLELFPVNPKVNSVQNDSPELLTPAQGTGNLFP